MARTFKTSRPMTLWAPPPRPPQAVTGKPQDSRLITDRRDATIQALEAAIARNARMGKKDYR